MWKHIYVEVIDWVGVALAFRFYFNGRVSEGRGERNTPIFVIRGKSMTLAYIST